MEDQRLKNPMGVEELARIVDSHLNPMASTTTRTYTPPLMGTSARAAKRRFDNEGTTMSHQSIGEYEQRLKTVPSTYDSPPRQTTTTTTSTTENRTSSSSNESPSVDHVLEQAVELQRLSQGSTTNNKSPSPDTVIIERTEQYQVFLDSSNHEIRRTPSVSRTALIPITKIGHATDLDQAQAQIERLTDDHQAIQQLTRVLQEHNQITTKEYQRLPSATHHKPSTEK